MDYDICLRTRAKSVITYVETVALYRSIIRHIIIRTYVGGADLPKTLIAVNYRSRTKRARSFSRQEYGVRYFLSK
jgi:hypothetical protein